MGAIHLGTTPGTEVVELRHISGDAIAPLLEEETRTWRERLDWDFTPAADLVLEFVGLRSLGGFALVIGSEVCGYSYFIKEDRKGLVGDLYVAQQYRTADNENRLLSAVLHELIHVLGVRRIESQLMMLDRPLTRQMLLPDQVEMFHRTFMVREAGIVRLPETPVADAILFESWRQERHEDASRMVRESYRGHIDGRINDQYQSVAGSRQFLTNLIQYPGCGRFLQAASYFVFRKDTGLPCGLILASTISEGIGHITQVCVTPESRGLGIGYEMMRRAVTELEQAGCRRVSLTVTSVNESAIRLYERMGFQRRREFAAHVWDNL